LDNVERTVDKNASDIKKASKEHEGATSAGSGAKEPSRYEGFRARFLKAISKAESGGGATPAPAPEKTAETPATK
jgi:hypothetical protein